MIKLSADGTSECPSQFLFDETSKVSTKHTPHFLNGFRRTSLCFPGTIDFRDCLSFSCHEVWLALQQRFASKNQSSILQLRTAWLAFNITTNPH
ncbi:unnamed protein product [Malus baccata var. baccata]